MRLLLRSNAHRDVGDGGLEIAASPDTPRRELWQWDLRVLPADRPTTDRPTDGLHGPALRVSADLARGDGSFSRVEVCADPGWVTPSVDVRRLGGSHGVTRIDRGAQEIVAIIVGHGHALAEGRHRLGELDVMILEGDDPYVLPLAPGNGHATSVAVVRLQGTGAIGWVP